MTDDQAHEVRAGEAGRGTAAGNASVAQDGDPVGPANSEATRYVIYKGHFDDHVQRDPERDRRDHWVKKGLIEAVWGYAITCHKSQGSQWENVIVYDDGLGRTAEDRARWLYTAITRAEQGLVILD